jgi:periplasmic protein TonB
MVVGSALLHVGLLGLALVSPSLSEREPPRVIAVELVSPAPPAPAAAPKPEPTPPPEVEVAPPPPPPPPEPKQIVLPEKQTAPKPKEKPKEKPKPREETFKEPPKKQEENLDELLAKMRGSEKTPAPAPPAPIESATATTGSPSEGTAELSPEEMAWQARVKRKMKGIWIVPPGFRTQTLQTRVTVTLDGAGNIVGAPRITKKSGNPWYDDGVVRGLAKASPLPPPPEAGDWVMWFEPGDSL